MKKNKKILVKGFGSIGKRHGNNLKTLGFDPYILTNHPNNDNYNFIKDFYDLNENISHAIICSPTNQHLNDLKLIFKKTGCLNYLLEKPIGKNYREALDINDFCKENNINLMIAYNMRYLKIFSEIKNSINEILKETKLIKITAGNYLPSWRPNSDYTNSYSSKSDLGGGVHLDLSHEVDYLLWLIGKPKKQLFKIHKKISSLKISSIDYFKTILEYENFIVDLELDYFRKKERSIRFIGENKEIANIDITNHCANIFSKNFSDKLYFDLDKTYIDELNDFLYITDNNLATLEDALFVNKLIEI